MTYAICDICKVEQYCFPQLTTEANDSFIKNAVCPDCLNRLYNTAYK